MTFDDSDTFEVRADLIVEQIDDECLVLDMDRNVYFGLSPVGLLIWQAIGRGEAVGEVVEHLAERFAQVERDVLRADAEAFLSDLVEQGLARVEH